MPSTKRKSESPLLNPEKKAKIERQHNIIANFDYDYIPIALTGDAKYFKITPVNIAITARVDKLATIMSKFIALSEYQDLTFYLQNVETHKSIALPQNPPTHPKYDIVLYLFTDHLITKEKDLDTFSEMQAIKNLFENKQFSDKSLLGISYLKKEKQHGYEENQHIKTQLEKYAGPDYKLEISGFSVGYGSIDGLKNSRLFVTFSIMKQDTKN